MPRHRYEENKSRIDVEVTSASSTVFLPWCTASKGERLKLRLQLPSGQAVRVRGRVVKVDARANPPGCQVILEPEGR